MFLKKTFWIFLIVSLISNIGCDNNRDEVLNADTAHMHTHRNRIKRIEQQIRQSIQNGECGTHLDYSYFKNDTIKGYLRYNNYKIEEEFGRISWCD